MRRSTLAVLVVGAVVVGAMVGSGCNPADSGDLSLAATGTTTLAVGGLPAADGSTVVVEVSSTAAVVTAESTSVAPTALPGTTAASAPAGCDVPGDVAVVDRDRQRGWTCSDGVLTREFPVSTAWSQPEPGTYEVYARDPVSWSDFGGHVTTLEKFVAFSYGKQTGARIAFHAIPVMSDGSLVQPLESVGDLARRGESAGCIRLRPDDADWIWNLLDVGDPVVILS